MWDMRFGNDDDADSSQVEDRRGSSFGGPMLVGGGGLGIVGVIAYVVIRLLGGNDRGILGDSKLILWPADEPMGKQRQHRPQSDQPPRAACRRLQGSEEPGTGSGKASRAATARAE